MGKYNPPKGLRTVVIARPTGKIQYIHVTEKVTMMQAQTIASHAKGMIPKSLQGAKRGVVKGRSPDARKRLLWAIAQSSHLFRGGAWFVTLTFGRDAPDWKDSKELFRRWSQHCYRSGREGFGLWVVEKQKRGAPHYHCLMSGIPPAVMICLKNYWLAIVSHTHPYQKDLRQHAFHASVYGESQVDAAVEKYLAKVFSREMTKAAQQDDAEHTGRTWGRINSKVMKARARQVDFMEVDRESIGIWLVKRMETAIAKTGASMGAIHVTEDGELVRLAHAACVDMSAEAREFIENRQKEAENESA